MFAFDSECCRAHIHNLLETHENDQKLLVVVNYH